MRLFQWRSQGDLILLRMLLAQPGVDATILGPALAVVRTICLWSPNRSAGEVLCANRTRIGFDQLPSAFRRRIWRLALVDSLALSFWVLRVPLIVCAGLIATAVASWLGLDAYGGPTATEVGVVFGVVGAGAALVSVVVGVVTGLIAADGSLWIWRHSLSAQERLDVLAQGQHPPG